MNKAIYEKIAEKKEFSQLPKKDVEMAFSHFEKRQVSNEEKVKLTRQLLHKVFGAFGSRKLLSLKAKNSEWFLRKHLSTRERMDFYSEIYTRILKGFGKKVSVVDLGAGINGFSYKHFEELGFNVNYIAVESIGQFVSLMNSYFEKEKIKARAFHFSLFEIEKLTRLIKKTEKPRIIFMFKVIDSLEALKKDYSKKLISEIVPLADRIVVSFATESMIKRKKFRAKRKWILNFIEQNFEILDNFEFQGERFIVFRKG